MRKLINRYLKKNGELRKYVATKRISNIINKARRGLYSQNSGQRKVYDAFKERERQLEAGRELNEKGFFRVSVNAFTTPEHFASLIDTFGPSDVLASLHASDASLFHKNPNGTTGIGPNGSSDFGWLDQYGDYIGPDDDYDPSPE